MLEYLPVFPETRNLIKHYKPAERCLLYEAMMEYAFTGEEPDWAEDDMKWYGWDALKQCVDRANNAKQRAQKAGKASAEQRKATQVNTSQQTATQVNAPQHTATDVNPESKSKSKSESESEKENTAQARRDRTKKTEAMFEQFWTAYPRHTSKEPALKAFLKINPDDALLKTMLDAISRQKESAQWSDPQYIPHPSTWLNQRRWEDEVVMGKPQKTAQIAQTNYSQRDYEDTKPGQLPDWYLKMLEDEQQAEAAEKAGVTPETPQRLADMMVEEAME